MWPDRQETVDLVTFTEKTLNQNLQFLCSASLETLLISENQDRWITPNMLVAGEDMFLENV